MIKVKVIKTSPHWKYLYPNLKKDNVLELDKKDLEHLTFLAGYKPISEFFKKIDE